MANLSPSTFSTQADALLRKNLTYQKRHMKANLRLILIPAFFCVLLSTIQHYTDDGSDIPNATCDKHSNDTDQAQLCDILKPTEWPPLLQVPPPRQGRPLVYKLLFTAQNRSFAHNVFENMLPSFSTTNPPDPTEDSFISLDSLATYVLGTSNPSGFDNFYDEGFSEFVVYLQSRCRNESFISFQLPTIIGPQVVEALCARVRPSWRNSSSDINNELFRKDIYKDTASKLAFDFLNSNENRFNVTIWYNPVNRMDPPAQKVNLLRIPRSVNLMSNAYLQSLRGPGTKMLFEFVKEMPKHETSIEKDKVSEYGGMLFTWVILQLFPVMLTSLIYEKKQKLRIMMKMHGLGDGAYWTITYGYFLAISMIYVLCFVIFGSVLGLKFFTMNDYSIQFVFYMVYINLQISVAFLVSSIYSNVKLATGHAYSFIFVTGIVGYLMMKPMIAGYPRWQVILMELSPGFSLYRGLFEFGMYSTMGSEMGTGGMQWKDVSDKANGMKEILIIMLAEWIIVLFVAYYLDQVFSSGSGKSPLFFLKRFQKKAPSASRKPSIQSKLDEMDKADVVQEREKVRQLLKEPTNNHAIVCDDLKKIYPGTDGNPEKFAVRGLFLAVPRGECFGMLGPNGAGKTSFISMMIGLTKPSSGSAFVEGLDINTDMDGIYTCMGVCPQYDLLWESLTGREHLLFYGRLKNLKGSALTQAVEESLKSLNLFHGGLADKQSGQYSGGMKRRLSVAISLIGDPKVVYMDEPSTGLDPASRNLLWEVIRLAKRKCAILLTTHSMEEAEFLCDRLGIFVDGRLQCVGNPKELKGRYGEVYVFTMTTPSDNEEDVENLVQQLTPNANRIYRLSGTQKFELPKDEVKIGDVFRAVDAAKRNFPVSAWGLADTKLEDVFIKVARKAQSFQT